ncbi:MAG: T9SS type A sorting domain-containing protein [Bacteroidales bacterium]|jgi:hypothetical protein|nr:T9SS type A sorting domain-containing protein [Bacteroidales bacterium]HQG77984.1 M14 family zinc carboxypeptidase [Bacteroidales bacterium]
MRCRLFILILVVQYIALSSLSFGGTGDDKLRKIVREYGQAEVVIQRPDPGTVDYLTRNVSIRSVDDKSMRIILSPATVEWFISSGFSYLLVVPSPVKGIASASSMRKAMEWDSYPTYRQYDSIMRFFAREYPSICMLDTIGTTLEGRLVMALKISDNCRMTEDEPKVFLSSSMHGDETGGFILMLRLADYLLGNYDSDARTKYLVDNIELWINPLANPDGTYVNGEEIYMPVRGNAAGVDLNRNFPDPELKGTVRQKETLDMMKFMSEHRFVLSANFHSGAELVNYPWDKWPRDHADKQWFYNLCRAYADTVHFYSPADYMTYLDNGVTNGYRWYPVYGSRQDYVTLELGGREVTIEIDDNFITPVYELQQLWDNNRQSLLNFIESALYGIHGLAVDAENGDPVPVRVIAERHEKDRSEVYADSITGRFIRLISPGTWNLVLSADGYRDTTVSDVRVIEYEKTDLLVRMKRIIDSIDTQEIRQPLMYPNPGGEFVKAVLPAGIAGSINVQIFSAGGALLSDYNDYYTEGTPLILNINKLRRGIYIVRFTLKSNGTSYSARFILN